MVILRAAEAPRTASLASFLIGKRPGEKARESYFDASTPGIRRSAQDDSRKKAQALLLLPKLLLIHKVAAAVLLPAVFGAGHAEGLFFAVADGAYAITGNARPHECTLHGIGAIVTERQVIFGGTTLIAVAFHGKANSGMGR